MDPTRFDARSPSSGTGPSRRGLSRLLGGLALGAPLALLERREVAAGHSRCRSPKCAQSCPSLCHFCFIRPHAPTMCGGNDGGSNCDAVCVSDADCPTVLPFCVSHLVERATGDVYDICPNSPAFCVSISAC